MRNIGFATISILLLALGAAARPAAAQPAAPGGWGFRLGLADNPDQVVAGAHFSFGEVIPKLRFQPSVEVGAGDAVSTFTATLPLHYRYLIQPSLRVYFGLGLAVSYVDFDAPRGGSGRRGGGGDLDIGGTLVGGFERDLGGDREVFVELDAGGGAAYDTKLVVGMSFRRR